MFRSKVQSLTNIATTNLQFFYENGFNISTNVSAAYAKMLVIKGGWKISAVGAKFLVLALIAVL